MAVNATHDPQLRSWVESAHAPGTDFPIQNLPFGVFKRRDRDELPTGEQRRFLEDGDEVTMRGSRERDGCVRIGFGECRGVVLST